jgi:hypothetical protein
MKLKSHLLSCLKEIVCSESTNTTSSSDSNPTHDTIYFHKNRMYQHNILQINYTTYDVRQSQDILNPKTNHCDILLVSSEPQPQESITHQYQYAKIIGIYHVNMIYSDPTTHQYCTQCMEFLWVRHFNVVENATVERGWSTACLDQHFIL